jgi:hypothetical protein
MEPRMQIADIWRMIAGFCEVIPLVRLSSTCKYLSEKIKDPRIAKYRGLRANVGVTRAAATGDMSLVTFYSSVATDLSWALYSAVRYNHLDAIAYVGPLTSSKLNTAKKLRGERLQSMLIQMGLRVKLWYSQRTPIIITTDEVDFFHWVTERSGVYGDMEYIRALSDNGFDLIGITAQNAALYGHLEMLRAHVCGDTFAADLFGWGIYMACAARGGHMEILEWLVERVKVPTGNSIRPIPTEVCYWASWNGRVDILEFAIANGAKPNFEVCINAVVRGHLDILIVALAHGAPPRYGRLRRIARKRQQYEILCYLNGR